MGTPQYIVIALYAIGFIHESKVYFYKNGDAAKYISSSIGFVIMLSLLSWGGFWR